MMVLSVVHFLLFATCTCAFENLALGKPAWQKYDWSKDWGADKAVDGKYSDRSHISGQCTISAGGKETAEWRVDLQNVVSISYINIYYRTDNRPSPGAYYDRFAGFFLYISNTILKEDGHLCFHEIQNVSGTPTEDQRINCSVYGRYVIYYNERRPDVTYPPYYSQYAHNELCEVEVYGCSNPGYYGEDCNQTCPGNCREHQCDAVSGNCVVGCLPGYQGPHCSYLNLALKRPAWQKNNFPNKAIDWGAAKAVDGKYSDRSAGGNQCTISAGGKKTAEWRVDLQNVVSISHIHIYYRTDNTPSPGAYYSRFAGFSLFVSNTTSKEDGHLCFHKIQTVNGTPTENQIISCPVHGRYIIYYNERRPDVTYPNYYSQYAFNNLCELEVYGCPVSGYYGDYCDQLCPQNCQGQRCNISTGECLGCIPGYQGPRCSAVCDEHTYGLECALSCGNCSGGETCHHVNGTCLNGCNEGVEGEKCQIACQAGYYGRGCAHECSENCGVTKRCNRFTGECHGGCQPGWRGERCDKECNGGMYGSNCNQTCGHCINESQCHHINGTCLHGCSSGYEGSLCMNVCRESYWGINCTENCGTECVNQACHHESGVCVRHVKPQKKCDSCACNSDYTITIISIVVSFLIVITGSVMNYLIWRRNQHNASDFSTSRQADISNKLSTVDITDPQSLGDKVTSPYAELGALDHPNTYDELHHYAKADDKM